MNPHSYLLRERIPRGLIRRQESSWNVHASAKPDLYAIPARFKFGSLQLVAGAKTYPIGRISFVANEEHEL
ncbi:protein of unknown function [Methylocaldum szegediense]|uniref:Uncharacterized protein n=1 Tax=Methylocaldum szegediense TaxID=73780 RepID=A0ABM9I4L2_9GAMM|nr:protein of unknown function [Methylocaldum szegediense]